MAHKCLVCIVAAASLVAASIPAFAGPIVVEVNGTPLPTTYNSGQDILIEVDGAPGPLNPGLQPITTPVLIRLYDTERVGDNLPSNSIGKVTIHGSATVTGWLEVAVIWRDHTVFDPGFPLFPDTPLDGAIAATSFGIPANTSDPERGLVIRNPDDANDDSLKRSTRFAAAILGEIAGDITVGQVQ